MDPNYKGRHKSFRLWVVIVCCGVLLLDHYLAPLLGMSPLDPQKAIAIAVMIFGIVMGDSQRGIGIRATPLAGRPPQ